MTVPGDTEPTDWPVGIYGVWYRDADIPAILSNPYVTGLSIGVGWKVVQPTKTSFDWSVIDKKLALAQSYGKPVILRVNAGAMTPAWVLAEVPYLTFTTEYLYGWGIPSANVPVVWHWKYLSYWKAFITQFAARYGSNPSVVAIQTAGCGHQGEMSLPNDVPKWVAAGYTDAKLIRAWGAVLTKFRSAFPSKLIVLNIGHPFYPAKTWPTNVVQPVVDIALSLTPRAGLQSNALSANTSPGGPFTKVLDAAAPMTTVGYQMIGDAPTAASLRTAFENALFDGAGLSRGIDYVEVYGKDIVDPLNQDALRFLASGGQSAP